METKQEVKTNGQPYRGQDRRRPENAQLRLAVEARLIAVRRQREIDAAEEEKSEKQKKSDRDFLSIF